MRIFLLPTVSLCALASLSDAAESLRVTEFMAINASVHADRAGQFHDWIELYNDADAPANLEGWFLTDDAEQPKKWPFPAETIGAKEYYIVFASGENRANAAQDDLHTNFKLAREEGGYLALVKPDGTVAQAFVKQPAHSRNMSFGVGEKSDTGYLVPTPKAANGPTLLGFVEDTKFSADRGFYDQPFDLTITTATPDAKIIYTTDGRLPGLGNIFSGPVGTIYNGPIKIDKTSIIRAAAFKDGWAPSDVDTHTYLFLAQVIRQPKAPEGFPAKWATATADYAMDPRVVDDPAYKDEIIPGLKSIPTMSVVMEPDDLFHSSKGIYAQSEQRGAKWERAGSVEYIRNDGKPGFRETCGIRVHGFGWRAHSVQWKHSLRLEFSERYGKKKLDYPLFPDAPVERYDSIVIRAQGSKGWQDFRDPAQTQYLHDRFARDLAREMGRPVEGHSNHVHLYLNGLYWGLYNPAERPDDDFAAEYFGGKPEDYDVINRRTSTNEAIAGDLKIYNQMIALARTGLATPEQYAAIQKFIDVDDLIDYMLIHQYTTNRDGPQEFDSNNMRGIRKREEGAQFRFFVWDMEYSLWNSNLNININVAIANSASFVYSKLRDNAEFRLLYADHAHKHCFNDGAMTPTRVREIWDRGSNDIYSALIGESARWGDAKRPSKPYTRNAEWAAERKRLIETYFPQRAGILVKQLITAKLYPTVPAPAFSQHGGQISPPYPLIMTATTDGASESPDIYYTLDGSDPRTPISSEVSSSAKKWSAEAGPVMIDRSLIVKARALLAGQWSALNAASFVVGKTPAKETLVVSEVNYHPASPSAEEKTAGYSASDFEFVELANVGAEPLDVSKVRLLSGAKSMWTNPAILSLAPRGVLVAVKNRAAFAKRYGAEIPVWAEFTRTELDDGGETLAVGFADGRALHEFAYNDKKPWPKEADGDGYSLTAVLGMDPSKPESWSASAKIGGTPGQLEGAVPPPIVGAEDRDGDGLSAWVESAFGTSDTDAASKPQLTLRQETGRWVLESPRNESAKEVAFRVESSADLKTWTDGGAQFEALEAGPGKLRFRQKESAGAPTGYLRLRVSRLP